MRSVRYSELLCFVNHVVPETNATSPPRKGKQINSVDECLSHQAAKSVLRLFLFALSVWLCCDEETRFHFWSYLYISTNCLVYPAPPLPAEDKKDFIL